MDTTFDRKYYSKGELIGGIDESGVSDIAGPLVAACVILPKIDIHRDDLRIFEVDDSKKIPEKYRKGHAEVIWQTALAIGIGEVPPAEIDFLGKEAATRLAMLRAVIACKTTSKNKPTRPHFLMVDRSDGVKVPINIPQTHIPQGDQKSLCIASASVIAKVYRDDIMVKFHEKYPYYDWINNKGYPCEAHFKGIDTHGIQIGIHRIKRWPFTPRKNQLEDRVEWGGRRKLWRVTTERALGKEIGDKLWTSNPPLSAP